MIETRILKGQEISSVVDALARLRIEVFRDFPYLYDGDLDYEARYLAHFLKSDEALVVGAFDGESLIGAATGSPLEDHDKAFQEPLAAHGLEITDIYYCAESVLLPSYRRRGLGHVFFDEREAHARELGRRGIAFCSVLRENHPMTPKNYRPLNRFWTGRGFAPLPHVTAKFAWKEIGDDIETAKVLQFWYRSL